VRAYPVAVICPRCEAGVPAASRFCPSCGTRLSATCGACGTSLDPGDRFCRDCGTPAGGTAGAADGAPSAATAPVDAPSAAPARVAERRQVSVLFADLVGFTSLSEQRDPEEVRELLTRYFDTARTVIARYGGNVEKFIGDAVMAMWGAPVAKEDDAERAVRAALDLVAAVTALGAEVGAPGLQLRAGVVTGEAAITLGAQGQGMVAGDVVNTASRVQSAAAPGAVLVDDSTRRLTDAPIAYEDAGRRELKGKAEPVHLWQAIRVVAMLGGKWRAGELEAPFVGRDGEFRLLKDLFHATIEERRARLVSVTGLAGIGKTRLAWEFEKYIDGLSESIFWHRGRCLAYGEGVTYWALAEMVRRRTGILEAEAPATALEKMHVVLQQIVPDAEERRWLEPRIAHLLGLEDRTSPDRVDLFAAWRLFLERLAEQDPTVLIFEEFQWADAGLVEFVEYLLDWSRHHSLFVVTLARPDLIERYPTWGSGKRSFHSLHLEPLSSAAMDELLAGLVPGLPSDLSQRIRDRAEGVPLYAVETVRMLLDRGLLQREGNQYAVAGPVDDLAVPESLHALIAARLDALPAGERALVQDAAVLGQTFSRERLGALASLDDSVVGPLLDSLVHKEFLTVTTDPRSPERGQYGFLQALVQRVAYETLSRHDRKERHLAAARHLEATWAREGDEVAEVVAAHYLEAHRAAREDADAAEIADSARRMLVRAGQRATSLGSTEDAERYYLRASQLSDDPVERAGLLEQAGEMARRTGNVEARQHLETAIELLTAAGQPHPAARVLARLGSHLVLTDHADEGIARLEEAFAVLREDEPDGDLGRLAAELGRAYVLMERPDEAAAPLELAIEVAEAEGLADLLAETLITKSFLLSWRGRRAEPLALQQSALAIAVEHDIPQQALRAHYNLADLLARADRFQEAAEHAESATALARRLGYRDWEVRTLGNLSYALYLLGRWDEIVAECSEAMERFEAVGSTGWETWLLGDLGAVNALRGDVATAGRMLASMEELHISTDPQTRLTVAGLQSFVALAEGRHRDALESAECAFDFIDTLGPGEMVRDGFAIAVDAALSLGDLDKAEALLHRGETLPRNNATRYLTAHALRLRARLAAARGEDGADVESGFVAAAQAFADLGVTFWRAVTLLEHAEFLAAASGGGGDAASVLLAEARGVFAQLGARPWSERAALVTARPAPPAASVG